MSTNETTSASVGRPMKTPKKRLGVVLAIVVIATRSLSSVYNMYAIGRLYCPPQLTTIFSNSNVTTGIQKKELHIQQECARPRLDFAIIGFSKCGTTTMHEYFDDSLSHLADLIPGEVQPPPSSISLHSPRATKFFNKVCRLDPNSLHGLKHPVLASLVFGPNNSIDRYRTRFPNDTIKFIVGLRHPVALFESFYNYRAVGITESDPYFLRNRTDLKVNGMLHASALIGFKNSAVGVSTDMPRFDIMLLGLGKTQVTEFEANLFQQKRKEYYSGSPKMSERIDFANYDFQDIGGPVFVYDLRQLGDLNITRSELFRRDLAEFLGLGVGEGPLPPFPHENGNSGGRKRETIASPDRRILRIDICDEEFAGVRKVLVENGKRTSSWLLEKFAASPGVTFGGGGEHFRELIRQYGEDICPRR